MPIIATRNITGLLERAPTMASLSTPSLVLEKTEVFHLIYEIDFEYMEDMVPVALNPTIPPIVSLLAYRCPASEIGSFSLVLVRVGCRAGAHPRGFVVGAAIDGPDASDALSQRWGIASKPADIS